MVFEGAQGKRWKSRVWRTGKRVSLLSREEAIFLKRGEGRGRVGPGSRCSPDDVAATCADEELGGPYYRDKDEAQKIPAVHDVKKIRPCDWR